ncbi:putative glycosyltransferase EpsF [Lentibacillus sp. JNUCC-1]|uniref:glycosyltransferase family 1 protein n=1 Tax=Lentibacillus sp. JNUCC-1 TaxID=2654513 RepID=UPI0012E70E1A|nr:glycosyltransferase family 1 protein [Lentibacillus sp. JNUCC-1]MUV36911.1 putative glycosyltransferase EpsF [Lentibacillus sp. JNUCC-1]
MNHQIVSHKPLKVLHVVGAMNRAGTETMLMNLYRHMDPEHVTFDFISYSHETADYDGEIMRLGGRIIRLEKTNSLKSLYQTMKQYGPYDAVHAHTLFHCGLALFAAKLAGIPIRIAHAHTTEDDQESAARKLYHTTMRRMIRLWATDRLACSNGAAQYLFGDQQAHTYFPNVIDYEGFLESPVLNVKRFKREAQLEKRLVVGHVGRFIEAKNHAFMLPVLNQLRKRDPHVNLLLVGDGDLRDAIEEKAEKAGLLDNVRFTGVRGDIATLLHSMDVFVFPSVYEGLGLVLLEAQACGLPCVVSDAIQPEADLGLGLVTRLSLQDSPEVWADHVLEAAIRPKPNPETIKHAFRQQGFAIASGISALKKIYHSNEGETDDQVIDHIL